MITSEQQYRNTKMWLKRFEQALDDVDRQGRELDPRARQALRDQYRSQIEELQAVLAEYEVSDRERVASVEEFSLRQPEHAPSLTGVLTRLGLTLNDLAAHLRIPPSVALKLQRGRIDPETVDQRLFTQLGAYLRLSVEASTQLVSVRPPVPRLTHARSAGETSATGVASQEYVHEDELMSFRDALVSAPELTEDHIRAWLESTDI